MIFLNDVPSRGRGYYAGSCVVRVADAARPAPVPSLLAGGGFRFDGAVADGAGAEDMVFFLVVSIPRSSRELRALSGGLAASQR